MEKLKKIKDQYLQLRETDGISELDLNGIEKELDIKLPLDFKQIAMFYSGGDLGGIENYSFSNTEDGSFNIVEETKYLRLKIQLPLRFIVLAEPPESIIVMDTENTPNIIWCDAVEVSKLEGKSFISKPDEWNSYSEYFIHLLEDEL